MSRHVRTWEESVVTERWYGPYLRRCCRPLACSTADEESAATVNLTEYRRDDVGMGCTYAAIVDTMMMISSAVWGVPVARSNDNGVSSNAVNAGTTGVGAGGKRDTPTYAPHHGQVLRGPLPRVKEG